MTIGANQNFEIIRGRNFTLTVTTKDSNGAAVNIAGTTIEWRMGATRDSESADLTKTTAAGITISDGANGIFVITVDDSDTDDLDPGRYYHEGMITDASGNKTAVVQGYVTILKGLIE